MNASYRTNPDHSRRPRPQRDYAPLVTLARSNREAARQLFERSCRHLGVEPATALRELAR